MLKRLQRRDAESAEQAQSSCHDGVVVELDGKPWQASRLQWHGGGDRPSPCVACRASQCRDKPTDDKKRSSVPPGSTQNQRVAGGVAERRPTNEIEGSRTHALGGWRSQRRTRRKRSELAPPWTGRRTVLLNRDRDSCLSGDSAYGGEDCGVAGRQTRHHHIELVEARAD